MGRLNAGPGAPGPLDARLQSLTFAAGRPLKPHLSMQPQHPAGKLKGLVFLLMIWYPFINLVCFVVIIFSCQLDGFLVSKYKITLYTKP